MRNEQKCEDYLCMLLDLRLNEISSAKLTSTRIINQGALHCLILVKSRFKGQSLNTYTDFKQKRPRMWNQCIIPVINTVELYSTKQPDKIAPGLMNLPEPDPTRILFSKVNDLDLTQPKPESARN